MKALHLHLMSQEGDLLETIMVNEFAISEEAFEFSAEDNEEILERVAALYSSVVDLMQERQAHPRRGLMWLKLALGDALLTADQQEGDVVIPVTVRPLQEGA
jgi:hypothetical protein